MKKTNNKGFSLVELIIVIAIMAVLIGVLAPQFIKYVEQSRESTDLQNITEIKTAVESYVADNELTKDATITVTAVPGGTITVAGVTGIADALKEYGVTGNEKMKSKAWASNIVWTYKNYSWGTAPSVAATYYNADGTKVGAAASPASPATP